mgnify:CR=1 FL=1
MIKGLLLCAAACAAPMTAKAGETDLPIVPNLKALLAADGVARTVPGRKLVRPRPTTFMPIAYRGLEGGGIRALPTTSLPQEPIRLTTDFSIAELRARPLRHLAAFDTGADATSARGGSWAVYDILSDYRKPRFRRSAFSTMLVLRIDGEEGSAPLSVGGGGVASAIWQVMPGN